MFGKHLTNALLKTGKHTVTAITRPNSSSKLPEGVRVEQVDYSGDDLTALAKSLRGQQFLIVTMAFTAPRDTVTKLVRAAAQAGVPYVMPNWFGHDAANKNLCDDSMLTAMGESMRAEIETLGVSSYIQLVCNFWYEFSLGGGPDRFGFDFKKKSLMWFDDGDVPINVSTWAQCARAVAALLSLKELPDNAKDSSPTLSQYRNGSVYISSFRLTQQDMFESVKRVTATKGENWSITHGSAEKRYQDGYDAVKNGNFAEFTKMLYARMWFPDGSGDYKVLDNEVLGLPKEDLDEYTAIAVKMGESGEGGHSHG